MALPDPGPRQRHRGLLEPGVPCYEPPRPLHRPSLLLPPQRWRPRPPPGWSQTQPGEVDELELVVDGGGSGDSGGGRELREEREEEGVEEGFGGEDWGIAASYEAIARVSNLRNELMSLFHILKRFFINIRHKNNANDSNSSQHLGAHIIAPIMKHPLYKSISDHP